MSPLTMQFEETFDSLCHKHPRFSVWNDCMHLWAYAIANCCDFRQDREEKYLGIVKRYSDSEALKISELLALLVQILEENREQDFLGQMYMDNGFGDFKKGQYFTPYNVACMTGAMVSDENEPGRGYAIVNDPASGSGVMLIAYINKLIKDGHLPYVKAFIVANDSDPCIAMMCYVQLSLLGAAGYVCVRNTLTEPMTGKILSPPDDAFITPLFYHPIWTMRRYLCTESQ